MKENREIPAPACPDKRREALPWRSRYRTRALNRATADKSVASWSILTHELIGRCLVQLFGHDIAALRIERVSEFFARRLLDPGGKRWLAVHQSVKIQGVQYQQACWRHGRHGCRATRAAQRRDLAKELAGAEPQMLVTQLYFHFTVRNEVHRMGGLAAAGDDRAAVHLLRAQHRHHIRDLARGQGAKQRNTGDKAPSDDEI